MKVSSNRNDYTPRLIQFRCCWKKNKGEYIQQEFKEESEKKRGLKLLFSHRTLRGTAHRQYSHNCKTLYILRF